MSEDIYYNLSEDDWTFASESLEEVVEQCLEDLSLDELKIVKTVTLYKGVKQEQTFKDFLDVDWLLENMHERAYDDNEFAEDYLYNVTEEQKAELESLICEWASKHNIAPNFFLINKVEEIEVEVDQQIVDEIIPSIESGEWRKIENE